MRNTMLGQAAAFGFALLGFHTAHAGTPADSPKLGFVFEGDIEYGGDNIATVNFVGGSSQHVKTGQGLTVAIGGHYRAADSSPYSVRATVGYKYVTTAADNADINIGRTVFEVLGNYRWASNWWMGLGITHHTGIKFDTDGFARNVAFDDATGVTAELGWKWIALSYTNLDYTDEFGNDWDASSVGVTFVSKF